MPRGSGQKGVSETYYSKYMHALGHARQFRSKLMDEEEQAFYDGLVAVHGEGEVYRETPFPPYVVDFYVRSVHCAYELDGWAHEEFKQKRERDKQRDQWLLEFAGLLTMHVSREEALELVHQGLNPLLLLPELGKLREPGQRLP